LILKSLEDDDKGICKSFYPEMFETFHPIGSRYAEVKALYEESAGGRAMHHSYKYFNHIEKLLLEEGCHTPVPII